ncbi:MAG: rhomboid family intramembrane serine protease [Pseudomonadota bacterium]
MKSRLLPYCTLFLSLLTVGASLWVAQEVTGSLLGKVTVIQLERYGGVTFDHLRRLEIWRLVAAQLIHAKQLHMIYNVLSLLLLGMFIERHVGFARFFVLWLLPGAAGTLLSTLFVEPPWNVGTGASQAVMGIAAFGLLLMYRGVDPSRGLKAAIAFALIPALALDLAFAHYPKPGHLLGFLGGLALGGHYYQRQAAAT